MGLLDLIRKAPAAEREAATRELVDVPSIAAQVLAHVRGDVAPPADPRARVVLSDEERRAAAAERAQLVAAMAARLAEKDKRTQRAERLLAEAQKEHDEAWAVDGSPTLEEQTRLNELHVALVNGRPELADRLRDRCRLEDEVLSKAASAVKLPGTREAMLGGYITKDSVVLSNFPHVQRRRAALAELTHLLGRWTRLGEYSTEQELQGLFDAAWSALPAVPEIEELLRRHRRGAPRLGGLPDPPAAA